MEEWLAILGLLLQENPTFADFGTIKPSKFKKLVNQEREMIMDIENFTKVMIILALCFLCLVISGYVVNDIYASRSTSYCAYFHKDIPGYQKCMNSFTDDFTRRFKDSDK